MAELNNKQIPRKPGKGHKEPKWFKPFKQEMLEFKQTVLLFIKTQNEFNKTIAKRLDNLVVKNNLVE